MLRVAFKEWREWVRDGRMRLLGGLLLALLAAAFTLGLVEQRRVSAERAEALRLERENWLEQGDKNPHGAAHDGMHVFKPLAPLAFFDAGVEAYLGTSVFLEGHRQNHLEHPPAADFGGLHRFGAMTPAFLLQALVPLVLILGAFGAFAGEREQGTLRQALSAGVSPLTLLAGQLVAGGILIAVTLALVLGAAGWLGAWASPADAKRLVLLAAGYGLYYFGFLALTLAVSARVRAARTVLVIMLGFWTLTTFVVPRVLPHVIRTLAPLPTLAEFDRQLHAALAVIPDGHNTQDAYIQTRVQALLREHRVARPEQLPFNVQGLLMLEGEERSAPVLDRRFGALWDRIEGQSRLRLWAGLLAPSLAIEAVSMSLAGTDFAHHRHFAAAAEQQRRALVKVLNEDMMRNSKFGEWQYKAGRAVWERVPEFHYQPPGPGWALRRALPAVLVLVFWAGLTTALAVFAVRRLQPI